MSPKKNKNKHQNSHLLLALIVVFILVAVFLCLMVLFGQEGKNVLITKQKSNVNTFESMVNLDKKKLTTPPDTIKVVPENKFFYTSKDVNLNENQDGENRGGAGQGAVQSRQAILCTEEAATFCSVRKTSEFAQGFDINLFETGVFIEGVNVVVEKISHQLVFRQLDNNRISDGTGKTLISSSVTYKTEAKELVILVGVDRAYYQSLSTSEQQTLYKSQLVRTVFSVTNELPSNYPKVMKVVGKLSYWDPNSE